jgi:hypothetical protein
VAFVLIAVVGAALLWNQWNDRATGPIAVFVSLLITSPFLLAYASVTMTEVTGALAQLVVILCYERYSTRRDAPAARTFALALTGIFFLKYNYFIMIAVPLAVHEFLERTRGRRVRGRLQVMADWGRRAARSWTVRLLALYAVGIGLVLITGGIQFSLFGQRVSIRTVGNSGQIVLYVLAARLWYQARRGRIDWLRFTAQDPLIRPLLIWFALPVALWFASPHPNHIRDFFNLVINLSAAPPADAPATSTYLGALQSLYFYRQWLAWGVLAIVAVAFVRYGRQPPLIRLLLLSAAVQGAALAIHHTKFPRFLLPTFVLLCLIAAAEMGAWLARRSIRLAAMASAPFVIAAALLSATRITKEDPFRVIAFEHYIDSPALGAALTAIRTHLRGIDRLLFIGETEQISPALLRWHLGPPSGVACAPYPIGGERRLDPPRATRVLLIVRPDGPLQPINSAHYNPARVEQVVESIRSGELHALEEIELPDLGVVMRLFGRADTAAFSEAGC